MRMLLLLCLLLSAAARADTCAVSSGPARASLLELYTSEGCSSCPPADRWLSQLPPDAGVVALAFHVDYWDRLGWRDPYAQAAFSQRQRLRNRGAGWVYTPQVMLDGADFSNWRRGLPVRKAPAAQAHLALSLAQAPGHLDAQANAGYATPAAARGATLYLALYENRLLSRVGAGENAQRTLRHDRVVRELAGPFGAQTVRHRFALQPHWKATDLGVAAFVLDARGTTLQALDRPGCP